MMLRRSLAVSAVLSVCLFILCGLLISCGGGGGGATGAGEISGGPQVIGGGQTTITGQVVDATNVTSPIPDAYVYVPLSPPTEPSSHRALPSQVIAYDITDQQGNYRLQNVPGGTVTMVVEPPETSNFNSVQLDITAPDAGEINIRLTVLPKSLCVLTVLVDPSSALLHTGDTHQFTATVLDKSGQEVEAAVIWTVTGGIGSVDTNGLFTASAPGSGKVVAIAGDKTGWATVRVEPRSGCISGLVTNAQTGGGIPGATVTTDGKSCTTDAYGAYTISGLATGDYTVTAYAYGYEQGSVQVTLAEWEGASANIALTPQTPGTGSVIGTVTDASTGDPIEGARVSAGSKSTITDSNGNYALINLSPGNYTVIASKAGYKEASATVTVEADKTFAANITLILATGSVTGKVTHASTGAPIADCTVSADGKTATTDTGGNYTISNLLPGDYTVVASKPRYKDTSVTVNVEAGQAVTANIALAPEPYPKWWFATGGRVYSSPAIGSDGTIYVASYDSNSLYAINPDGSEKWRFTMGGHVYNIPAIGPDGTIYVGSYDNNLHAVNPDGSEKWRFATGVDVDGSPAVDADGTIYVGSGNNTLYAVNPDGSEKWRFVTGGWVQSSPAIGSDGTIYVGSDDYHLYALNPDGSEKWRFAMGSGTYRSSPAIGSDGTIYVGSCDLNLYAVNPDGSEKWRFTTGGAVNSSPVVASDGTIYVGSDDDNVYAVNPDGSEKWRFAIGADVEEGLAIGSDGTVYVGAEDNNLYAINPDGSEKWRFTTGGAINSSPAIGADGTIYVGSNDGYLYAIGVPGETPQLDTSAPWPMFHHDIHHTGRYGYVPSAGRFFRPW